MDDIKAYGIAHQLFNHIFAIHAKALQPMAKQMGFAEYWKAMHEKRTIASSEKVRSICVEAFLKTSSSSCIEWQFLGTCVAFADIATQAINAMNQGNDGVRNWFEVAVALENAARITVKIRDEHFALLHDQKLLVQHVQ